MGTSGRLVRVQLLIEPDQRRVLRRIAKRRGTSVAALTRIAIREGIDCLERQDAFELRGRALREAERRRTETDVPGVTVAEDIHSMRRERDGGR